jgi:ATP synthase protein I
MKRPGGMNLDATGAGVAYDRRHLLLLFIRQFVLLLLATILLWIYQPQWMFCLLAGGLIQIVPAIYFAWRVFGISTTVTTLSIVKSFYRGETGKFLMTALGFALAFKFMEPLYPPALFLGFGLMLIGHTIGVARFSR